MNHRITAASFQRNHAQRISDAISLRSMTIYEGENVAGVALAAQRVLGYHGAQDADVLATSTAICIAYWNERYRSALPCHYCMAGLCYEVDNENQCIMCAGTRIHPDGDDPHNDGEGWNGFDCGVCGGVS